jgi:hypothetical protein
MRRITIYDKNNSNYDNHEMMVVSVIVTMITKNNNYSYIYDDTSSDEDTLL